MAISYTFSIGRLKVAGILGVVLLIGSFALPTLLAASLDEATAERWIRQHLHERVVEDDLHALGGKSVQRDMAKRWQTRRERIDAMRFARLEIKHFLVAPPSSSTRIYVAKADMRYSTGEFETRYFSLSARNDLFDFFWVAEQPAWMWYLSF